MRLLDSPKVRRLLGIALTAQGLLGFLLPRRLIKINARLFLREMYENPGDLEPTDTYVNLVRDASLAAMVFGALTLRRAAGDEATSAAEAATAEAEAGAEREEEPAESENDEDGGAIELDIDSVGDDEE